ncbi:MAG: reactive intermediate/imine deaminase [Porticoccaceae bacterium]|nr:MAG: reactive intermediate/imine deaminase [Porticoccaceae bacterium]
MVNKAIIHTTAAPAAIGTYSQAVKAGDVVYLSGQIGLDPATGELVEGGFEAQARRVLANLAAVCEAAGGSLRDLVKLTVYLTDLDQFEALNRLLAESLAPPFPARAVVEVRRLPRGALVEIDGVMVL